MRGYFGDEEQSSLEGETAKEAIDNVEQSSLEGETAKEAIDNVEQSSLEGTMTKEAIDNVEQSSLKGTMTKEAIDNDEQSSLEGAMAKEAIDNDEQSSLEGETTKEAIDNDEQSSLAEEMAKVDVDYLKESLHTPTKSNKSTKSTKSKTHKHTSSHSSFLPSPNLIHSPIYRRNALGNICIPLSSVEDDFYEPQPEHKLVAHLNYKDIRFYHKFNDKHPTLEECCYMSATHEENNGCICFTLAYSHIWEMSFYRTRSGMLNKNPTDYFVNQISTFMYKMRENNDNLNSPKTVKLYKRYLRESKGDSSLPSVSTSSSSTSSSSFVRFFKRVFNKIVPSSNVLTNTKSTISLNEDELIWTEDDSSTDCCFISINYRDSFTPHLDMKTFYFRTTKENANKIHYFLCNGVLTIVKNSNPRAQCSNLIESFNFEDFAHTDRILSRKLLLKLRYFIKPSAICKPIFLAYSTRSHGTTLNTLYRKCEPYYKNPCILIIKDYSGKIFGAILSESPSLNYREHYFGDGSCCVFKYHKDSQNIDVYRWSYDKDYFIVCDRTYLAIGASKDMKNYGYAIWLSQDLYTGTTEKSTTFKNSPLTSQLFRIVDLEVWVFGEQSCCVDH